MSSYKCHACGKKGEFEGHFDASSKGWALGEVWAGASGGVKYFVYCPAHRPAWVEEAVKDGARKGPGSHKGHRVGGGGAA